MTKASKQESAGKTSRAAASRPRAPAPARPLGRSLADFMPLRSAERKLLDCARRGNTAWISNERPEKKVAGNSIRAEFLRFLILGGDDFAPVHEKGVNLAGAFIEGILDLEGSKVDFSIYAILCKFDSDIILYDATTRGVTLSQSSLKSILGDRLRCSGSISMRDVRVEGETRLLGSSISGNLELKDSSFVNDGIAILLDSAEIGGNIFANGHFEAVGEVRLLQARVSREVTFDGASFRNESGAALSCDYLRVGGAFFFRELREIQGSTSLSGADVAMLNDDEGSWRAPLFLNGFTYDRIGMGPTDARSRIAWLKLQQPKMVGDSFWPQPWEHLVKVLREMGHFEDAKVVAIQKQKEMRLTGLVGQRPVKEGKVWRRLKNHLFNAAHRLFHGIYGTLAGYGYRPLRTVGWMALVWLVCGAVFMAASREGLIGPANSGIYANPQLGECGSSGKGAGVPWTRCRAMPPEYAPFDPFVYSLDVILPLLDLRQESEWRPIVHDADGGELSFGHALRFLMWFEILFGWITSLLLVSALGKLVQKD
jgi:hypothetical protein